MTATAIIDMGTGDVPLWGEHTAALSLKRTPEFTGLLEKKSNDLSVVQFIDFADDWAQHIEFVDEEGQELEFKASINAIRRITVSSSQERENVTNNFNESHSAMDAIEVKSKGAVLPAGFKFCCNPYDDFNSVKFLCALRPIIGEKQVKLVYRIIGLDAAINTIADEFKQMLDKALSGRDISIFTGTMAYQK